MRCGNLKIYNCVFCGKDFIDSITYEQHFEECLLDHIDRSCTICGEVSNTIEEAEAHRKACLASCHPLIDMEKEGVEQIM